jgi:hypothetical protein
MDNATTRSCKECGIEKPLQEFTKARLNKNWKKSNDFRHASYQQYHSYCKICNAEKARAYRKAYSEKHGRGYQGTGKLKKVPPEDRKLMSLIRGRITEAKGRANKYNQAIPDIDEDYLYELMHSQDRKCAATGCAFVIEKKHPLCPSLDKIEPSLGYVKGNVQWLSWAANRAKGDLTNFDFIEMCRRVVEVSERATTIP